MKIVNIVPGFGGSFYCGNCLRDSHIIKALNALKHDAMFLPVYLPLSLNSNTERDDTPVFFGAVNIYLKQYKLFRRMPNWLYRFFNSQPILRFAAKKSGSTRATGLENMTISMLEGANGQQAQELNEIIDYLKNKEKPDIVHLSNSLLLGMAAKIRSELKIPVICSLQDEDVWVDDMAPDYRDRIWDLMAQKARDIDAFMAVSSYFGNFMMYKLRFPKEKLFVLPIGINPSNYTTFTPSLNPPVIGYLSRLCKENGMEVLIDAFIELKEKSVYKNTKLRLTGGKTGDDTSFIKKQLKKLENRGYLQDVEIIDYSSTEVLRDFFSGLTVTSVPVLKGEAFGMYQLESMVSGIPVVQPALAAFPEIIDATGGGVVYYPNNASSLATALSDLFSNPEKLIKMSVDGRNAVTKKYNSTTLAQCMVGVYEQVVADNTLKNKN